MAFLMLQVGSEWSPSERGLSQFVLALGNRPKGERGLYLVTLWVYAALATYLIVCSVILSVKAFDEALSTGDTIVEKLRILFNKTNGVLVAAVMSTIGIYLFASILYSDPWHMFSSFPQYMLLAPSFTNVLNVYAFCNLHDVSWGTKGSDKAEALPAVSSSKEKGDGGVGVVEDVQRNQEELDESFQIVVRRAVAPFKEDTTPEKPSMDVSGPWLLLRVKIRDGAIAHLQDQNRTFRTRLVGVWLLSNAALAISIQTLNGLDKTPELVESCLKDTGFNANNGSIIVPINGTCIEDALSQNADNLQDKQQEYFKYLLWATFGLSAVRFIGVSR